MAEINELDLMHNRDNKADLSHFQVQTALLAQLVVHQSQISLVFSSVGVLIRLAWLALIVIFCQANLVFYLS